jgi:hypothetical protein
MRILGAGVVLITVVLFCGCASLQRYPSFGTAAGGGLVLYDRTGAHNLLPASGDRGFERPRLPETAQPIH